jgi:hypothetical protein
VPYKEKTAWLSLFAIVVTYGPYFTIILQGSFPRRPMPDFRQLALFGLFAIAQMVILGVGHLYNFLNAPEEARIPPDERDRDIHRRSITAAYSVLIFGMIVVGVVMPFYYQGWTIINSTLFTIIAAEIVHYSVVIFCYRRQS